MSAMVSVSTLLTAFAMFSLEAESALNGIAGAIVLSHLVAVSGGGDDGDIRFSGDVVTHVALRDVSIQFVNNDLQVDGAVRQSCSRATSFVSQALPVTGSADREAVSVTNWLLR